MKIIPILIVTCFTSSFAFAQTAPSAKDVMDVAFEKAKKENKHVFLKFSASWCGWCHKMDSAMADPLCKKFFNDNFVLVTLDIFESKQKKHLENASADKYIVKYKGDSIQGIPFWFILNKNEELLSDSYIRKQGQSVKQKGENIGCPASADEVEAFVAILKNITPLSGNQLQIISKRFRKNESN